MESVLFCATLPLRSTERGRRSSSEISSRFDEVRRWIRSLDERPDNVFWELEKRVVNHRELGRNSLPCALLFTDEQNFLGFLGKKKEYKSYLKLSETLSSVFPELRGWCLEKPHSLLEFETDWERLIRILYWIKENPRPGIYLRQLSLEGVDTKFIEGHRGILTALLDRVLPSSSFDERFKGVRNFEKRYGFLSRPDLIRFRFASPGDSYSGFSDLTVPAEEFRRMNPNVSKVFVVENDITALSFPLIADSLVVFGRGYHFDAMEGAAWINKKELYYWGDLDSHGFAILAQFREKYPHARSVLMDRECFLNHKAHWGREDKPAPSVAKALTSDEAQLMKDLIDNRYGEKLRLEQEFIPYEYVIDKLKLL
ncbi:MAG: hypothetical protein B6241_00555 [Spirochaetaceae bacterium 4572_59]|nr:MAG: hypothetical protein B6241_00555 [Spirochaetaceae bacterium 4572_59]